MGERMKLWQRLGQETAARLMAMKRREERQADLGLREVDEPSRADFELDRALMRTEFTPQERARIRAALGIDPKQGVDIPGAATPPENREEQNHG